MRHQSENTVFKFLRRIVWTGPKFQCIALLAAQSSREIPWNKKNATSASISHYIPCMVQANIKDTWGRGVSIMISFNVVEPNESKCKLFGVGLHKNDFKNQNSK